MFTKIYKALLALSNLAINGKAVIPAKTYNGTDVYLGANSSVPPIRSMGLLGVGFMGGHTPSSSNNTGYYFGIGDTAPTEDDYKLDTYFSNSSILSGNLVFNSQYISNNKVYSDIILVVINTSDTTQTIKEIGIFTDVYYSSTENASASSHTGMLIYREVFSEPIVLNSLEAKSIKLSFSTNIVSAS